MNTNLLSIVKQITGQYGENILSDPARLKAFFSDLAKDEPKPLRIAFGRCVENGAYLVLKTTPDAAERALRKASIAQRLRDEHGLDLTLCAEALDVLEAALYGTAQVYTPPPVHRPVYPPQAPAQTAHSQSVSTHPQPAPFQTFPAPAAKNNTMRNVLIAAGLIVAVIAGVALYQHQQNIAAGAQRVIALNEYGHIILEQIKNNDVSYEPKQALTLKHVQDVQRFIREKFPDFNFEEAGYVTDDYRNELLIKAFNDGPEYASIYLSGIEKMAGYSSVYARLLIMDMDDTGESLFAYWFSIDEEYSDRSGMEFYSSPLPVIVGTNGSDSIRIIKKMYSDANEYYWEIHWGEGISKRDKTEMIKAFMAKVRYAKVFNSLNSTWIKGIYTGIEINQRIGDLVEW